MTLLRLILCALIAGFVLTALPTSAENTENVGNITDEQKALEKQYHLKCRNLYGVPGSSFDGRVARSHCIQREFHQAETIRLQNAILENILLQNELLQKKE